MKNLIYVCNGVSTVNDKGNTASFCQAVQSAVKTKYLNTTYVSKDLKHFI